MHKAIEVLTNDQMVNLKNKGFTLIFYDYDSIHYEKNSEKKKFPVYNNGKKHDSLYLILTRGNTFSITQNLKHYSKKIKSIKIQCVLDYNDEIDEKQESYQFHSLLPELYIERMKKTFYDVTTEVLIFKEEEIKKYMETEDYLM